MVVASYDLCFKDVSHVIVHEMLAMHFVLHEILGINKFNGEKSPNAKRWRKCFAVSQTKRLKMVRES